MSTGPRNSRSRFARVVDFFRENGVVFIVPSCLLLMAAVLTASILQGRKDAAWARPFVPMLDEYKAICLDRAIGDSTDAPRLAGKIVVLSCFNDTFEIAKSRRRLVPKDLIAGRPEEVTAILLGTSFGEIEVGSYTSGARAYAGGDVVLEVIDVRSRRCIASMLRSGGRPPLKKYHGGPGRGSVAGWPDPEEMDRFLRQLQ